MQLVYIFDSLGCLRMTKFRQDFHKIKEKITHVFAGERQNIREIVQKSGCA